MIPTRRIPNRAARLVRSAGVAQDAIGTLTPGVRIVGLTKGQFGQIDILRAVVEQTGPADVLLSTWSVSLRHSEQVAWLMETRAIRSFRLLVDRSFPTRKSEWARQIWQRFGPEAIRCAYNHAKFIVIRNARWNICVRSSMNLNRNPRFEQFDLDDSPEICDFFAAHAEELFRAMPMQAAERCDNAACEQVLAGVWDEPGAQEPGSTVEYGPEDLRRIVEIATS